jgi:multidrug efflux pump subunit AcrA (membrane-fusion protein)
MTLKLIRNAAIGSILGILTLLLLWTSMSDAVSAEEEIIIPAKEVQLLTPSSLEANRNSIIAYGSFELDESLPLFFEANGTVERVYVTPGDEVYAGQVLAILSNGAQSAQVAQAAAGFNAAVSNYNGTVNGATYYQIEIAESQVNQAEERLEILEEMDASNEEINIQEESVRQAELNLRSILSGASSTQVQAQWAVVQQAQAGLNAAAAGYEMTVLRAPFTGTVVTFTPKAGEFASASQQIGHILNNGNGEVVTYLSSDEADRISGGNSVNIDERYMGTVVGISSIIDVSNGKRKVRIQLTQTDEYTPGEVLRVEITENKEKHITLVPLNAMSFDDDDAYVFAYKNGFAVQRKVQVAQIRGEYVEVISLPAISVISDIRGLSDGEVVTIN